MAETRKPNTICRNHNCHNGSDGGRKHFYACRSCVRNESWRAYCCCLECYEEYTRIVLDSRAKEHAKIYPERTDMSVDEIKSVMNEPVDKVLEYTKTVELADYVAENPNSSLGEIIDKVNADIDNANKKTKKKKS